MEYKVFASKYGYWVVRIEDNIYFMCSWERTFEAAKDVARALNINTKRLVG